MLSDFGTAAKSMRDWTAREPLSALLLVAITATFVYFFGFLPLFVKGTFVSGYCSTAEWAWQAWNPGMNQEHSKLVPLVFLGLLFYHREKLRAAPKAGSNLGLLFIAAGIVLFLLAARCLQPRLAIASVPFLIYGSAVFIWGRAVGRIILFPCAFLIFMIPVAAIEQATFRLQFLITGAIGFLSNLVGIRIDAIGTTLTAADGTFNFQIAEGCSGIRSLTAMTMITAIYVHIMEKQIWKKLTIFSMSVLFAIIGNIGRIFTIIIIARLGFPEFAGGLYHDYSAFIIFPFALGAMLLTSKLLNVRPQHVKDGVSNLTRQEKVTYDY